MSDRIQIVDSETGIAILGGLFIIVDGWVRDMWHGPFLSMEEAEEAAVEINKGPYHINKKEAGNG